ncbi:MAG: T9SS type A sorting domain-containing protein [Chitinophagales bacterium]|nr:T9SS type A sorting domain-containing protein [Chitinophagales bacterium]
MIKKHFLLVFLSCICISYNHAQTQKGQILESVNTIFRDFKLSGDGNTIVAFDIPETRTFKYTNGKWNEKERITNRIWDFYELSEDGSVFAGTYKDRITGKTKLDVYDFVEDRWVLRSEMEDLVFERKIHTDQGHFFTLSHDGNTLAVLNHTKYNEAKTFVNLLEYINGRWNLVYETTLEDFIEPYAQFDGNSQKLFVKGLQYRNLFYNKIELFVKENGIWTDLNIIPDVYKEYIPFIKFNINGNAFHCLSGSWEDTIHSIAIEKYDIVGNEIVKTFSQELPGIETDVIDISGDGRYFLSGYNPYTIDTLPVLYKYIDDKYVEQITTLKSRDPERPYLSHIQLSDNGSTIGIHVSDEASSGQLHFKSQIILYSFSDVSSLKPEEYRVPALRIYPNPTSDYIHVDLPAYPVDFVLMNVMGEVKLQGKLLSNTLDMSSVPPGIYVLSIENTGIVKVVKI